jgi:hypothetical protein
MYSVYSKNMKKDVGGNQVVDSAVSQEIRILLYGHKGEVMCDFNGGEKFWDFVAHGIIGKLIFVTNVVVIIGEHTT